MGAKGGKSSMSSSRWSRAKSKAAFPRDALSADYMSVRGILMEQREHIQRRNERGIEIYQDPTIVPCLPDVLKTAAAQLKHENSRLLSSRKKKMKMKKELLQQ